MLGHGGQIVLRFTLYFTLGLLTVTPQARAAMEVNEEFYSESAYLGRQNLVANQSWFRVRTETAKGLYPYLQLGTEAMTEGLGATSLDPGSSFGYLAPGVQWRFKNISLYGTSRFRAFYRHTNLDPETTGTIDLRALAVYGDYFSTPLSTLNHVELFLEPYGEMLFTSGDLSNAIADGFVRGGARWRATRRLNLDLFLEPFVTADRVGHYYNNLFEVRPSLRAQYVTGSLSFSVLGSVVQTTYFQGARHETNPYSQHHTGARVLAIFGGTF